MRHSILNVLLGASIAIAADTSGCGIARDFAGQTHSGKTIESSGGTRSYDVYLPPNYDENTQTPLIISYHGNHGDSTKQRALDRLDNTTWNNDHITVWPNGVGVSHFLPCTHRKNKKLMRGLCRAPGKARRTPPRASPTKSSPPT